MCGFAVAYMRDGQRLDQQRLDAMGYALDHRGPDERGQFASGHVAMRHRRLKIIDLTGGKQPMASPDGRFWIAYNGEIYNFRDLRCELEGLGHGFREHSDTEVLLAAWSQWNEACLERLNGMFAFAIYDAAQETLFAARDRFGEKPLYYADATDGFYLASELKALVAAGIVAKELDPVALYSYFTLGYVTGRQSIFRGAQRLAPGEMLSFSKASGCVRRQWWQPPRPTDEIDDAAGVIRQSLDILRDAVSLRQVADVPLGFFLSGGVDSSAIVALAAESGSSRLETFAIGFDDPALDERPYARFVAERFSTRHHEFVVNPKGLDALDRIAWHADEPFADSSALPTWYLSELTRGHVTAALSGDGGDEVFAGYDVYRGHALSERVRAIPLAVRRLAVAGLRASAPIGDGSQRLKLARNIEDAALPAIERFVAKQQTVFRREFLRAVSARLSAVATEATDRTFFHAMWDGYENPLCAIAFWQQTNSLPDDMLHKVDRMSMAHSLEVRAPFLDHRLVELLNRTSFAVKLLGGRPKHILRSALSGYFPQEFLSRRKQGFVVPLQRWFRNDLSGFVRRRLLAPDAVSRTIISTSAVERILAEHAKGTRNWEGALWALLMFEQWCRAYGIDAGCLANAA